MTWQPLWGWRRWIDVNRGGVHAKVRREPIEVKPAQTARAHKAANVEAKLHPVAQFSFAQLDAAAVDVQANAAATPHDVER